MALVAQLAEPAVALTCDRYGIQGSFRSMQEAGVPFLLVLGAFSDLQPINLPPADRPRLVLASGFEASSGRFRGHSASPTGFDRPFAAEVALIFPDYSGVGGTDRAAAVKWLPGTTGLVWLVKTDAGYRLTADPFQTLIDTDPDSIPLALRCLRGGDCPEE